MSVHPLHFPSKAPAPSSASGNRTAETARERFAEALEASLTRENSTQERARAGEATAQAMRLRMMGTSLLLDDDADENAVLPSQQLIDALVARYAAAGRKVDAPFAPPAQNLAPSPSTAPKGDPIDAIVARAAERYRVAPELVRAVIRAESAYDPQAISPVGAQGLMQLMPATARDMGVHDPFDPEQNVMGGTRYLRKMLDRYDGELDKALAAYNWGPGNLDRSDGRSLPKETRDYIAKIRSYLAG